MKRFLLAGALALATLVPATAQDMTAQDLVIEAASANVFEIQSSEIALERSQDKAVQQFAQQMVADHQQVGAMMESLTANGSKSRRSRRARRHSFSSGSRAPKAQASTRPTSRPRSSSISR